MCWLPEWFHVSSGFVYALVAFLGSVAILFWERVLERREVERRRLFDQWVRLQNLDIRAIRAFGRIQGYLTFDNEEAALDAASELLALNNEVVALLAISPGNDFDLESSQTARLLTEYLNCLQSAPSPIDRNRLNSLMAGLKNTLVKVTARTVEINRESTPSLWQEIKHSFPKSKS